MSNLKDFGFVVTRVPLLPLNKINQYDLSNCDFRDSLYLSSLDLLDQIEKEGSNKQEKKAQLSLFKYWNRACTRPTPYGLFAGCFTSQVTSSKPTSVEFNSKNHIRRARLDMNFMFQLIKVLNNTPFIQRQLKLTPNNSLYFFAGSIRYVEYSMINDEKVYELASIKDESYVKLILEKCKKGATIAELSTLLASAEDVPIEEAELFVLEMLDSQLLVSHLEPSIIGDSPLVELIEKLKALEKTDKLTSSLSLINSKLSNTKITASDFTEIEKLLMEEPYSISSRKNLFQVDLFFNPDNSTINKKTVNSILEQINDLLVFSDIIQPTNLLSFASRFYAKYEDEEVELMTALDADVGVGYGDITDSTIGKGLLIDGIPQANNISKNKRNSDSIQQLVLKKYIDFLENKKSSIEISIEDIQQFKNENYTKAQSSSFFVLGELINVENKASIDDDFCFYIKHIYLHAAKLLGRFAYGDTKIYETIKNIAAKESEIYKDGICAEVAHWPQGRVGNILLRPVFRDYEIPYLGNSGAEESQKISAQDLVVSVRGTEVVLRSKKLGKRIFPMLTTAHAYSNKGLPLYKFLGDMQYQNVAAPSFWNWGGLTFQKYLPRVTYKNLILKYARWKISKNDLKDLPKSDSEHVFFFKNLFEKEKIPELVVFIENENEILIDVSAPEGVNLLQQFIHKYHTIELHEYLFKNNQSFISDESGNGYVNETLIPFYRDAEYSKSDYVANSITSYSKKILRNFHPNSEWITFKIYCGPKSAENVLKGGILNFLTAQAYRQMFDRFFFIRYKDDFNHIRIRFYNIQVSKQKTLQENFLKELDPYLQSGLIHKLTIDTYKREIERYSESLIEAVEELFHCDSICTINFLALLDEDNEDIEFYRLIFAMRSVDHLLSDLGFNQNEKIDILTKMYKSFFIEHGGTSSLQKTLNSRYQKYKAKVFTHMNPILDEENSIVEIAELLKIRSENSRLACDAIKKIVYLNGGIDKYFGQISSCTHMLINRVFISNQRKFELVVYLFLERYYTSMLAIQKAKKNKKE